MAQKKTANKSAKTKKTTRAKSKKHAPNRLWQALKIGAVLLGLSLTSLALIFVLNLPSKDRLLKSIDNTRSSSSHKKIASKEKSKPKKIPSPSKHKIQRAIKKPPLSGLTYEEEQQTRLEHKIRQIDLAILQSLLIRNLDPEKMTYNSIENKVRKDQKYNFQAISLQVKVQEKKALYQTLSDTLKHFVPQARLTRVKNDSTWKINIHEHNTHELNLKVSPLVPKLKPGLTSPRLALVIDDLGENLTKAERLVQTFNNYITFSVLPYCTHTREIAQLGKNKGIDVLLHLPMEPISYPETDPGPGSLFVNMTHEQIQSVLLQDIQQVPNIVGANNHMGSRFTTSFEKMLVALKVLKKNNLFFMDSLTSPKSACMKAASKIGLKILTRDVFLDNVQKVQAIKLQLKKAEHLALQNGKAVAIGHPYPETLQALEEWAKSREEEVELCKLSQLIDS